MDSIVEVETETAVVARRDDVQKRLSRRVAKMLEDLSSLEDKPEPEILDEILEPVLEERLMKALDERKRQLQAKKGKK